MANAVQSKKHRAIILLFLITYCAALWTLALLLRSKDNTLLDHPEWSVSKRRLEMQPFGSMPYLTGPQALAHNRLNLHPWHGYQELILREAMDPEEVQFRFRLEEQAYAVFIFNRSTMISRGGFAGIRFSLHPSFPSAFLIGHAEGAFYQNIPIAIPELEAKRWHQCQVSFERNPQEPARIHCHIDGKALPPFELELNPAQHLGFRGGYYAASIDDVWVRNRDGSVFREDFSNRGAQHTALRKALWMGLLALVPLLGLLRRCTGSWHDALSWATAINLCALPVFVVLFLFQTQVAAVRYPMVTVEMEEEEEELRASNLSRLVEEIRKDISPEPAPGVTRIVFLGTSQTRGEGASVRENGFVPRVEHLLNEEGAGWRVECLNASVPGDRSTGLLKMYRELWLDYKPRLTVINLSVNDRDAAVFAENLRDLVLLNREHGIDTMFVLEATSLETYAAAEDRRIAMGQAGEELGVPVIDSHHAMFNAADTGFLWWDLVHPTDYGHEVIAKTLVTPLRDWLEQNALR